MQSTTARRRRGNVQGSLQAWLRGHRLKEARRAVQVWAKIKNPNAPAATCVWTGAFEVVIRQAAGIP
jgi:hypothetical protein